MSDDDYSVVDTIVWAMVAVYLSRRGIGLASMVNRLRCFCYGWAVVAEPVVLGVIVHAGHGHF